MLLSLVWQSVCYGYSVLLLLQLAKENVKAKKYAVAGRLYRRVSDICNVMNTEVVFQLYSINPLTP